MSTRKKTYAKKVVKAPAKKVARRAPSTVASNSRWLAPALGVAGGAIGDAIFPGAGGIAGGIIGRMAGEGIHKITGLGDYTVHMNSLLNANGGGRIVNKNIHGGIVMRNREYIGDIISSGTAGAFKRQVFSLNPGQLSTFPFLSQVAQNYEEYSLEGMIFEYRTMSADALNSVNTALGQVIMATNYNAASPLFSGKAEMENYEFGHSCKPSVGMFHPIECEPRQTAVGSILYVRPGSVPAGQDLRLYDWGNFQIATNGFQGTNVNCGELWVEYQICLLKPKMFSSLGLDTQFAHASNTVGLTNATPLGTATSIIESPNQTLNLGYTTNVIFIPISSYRLRYKLTWTYRGSGAATIVYPGVAVTNGSIVPLVFDDFGQGEQFAPAAGTSSTICSFTILIDIDANLQCTVLIDGAGTLPTTPQNMDVFLIQLPRDAV